MHATRFWKLVVAGLAAIALGLLARVGSEGGRELGLLRNTLLVSLGVTTIAVPLGTLAAGVLLRTNVAGRRFALVVLVTLLFVPLFLQAAAWDAGFGRQGWLSLSTGTLATPLLEGWRAAIWIQAAALVPWVVLIVGLGFSYIEPELEEAASLEMPGWQVFLQVTVRGAAPALAVAAVWTMVTAAAEMTVTDLYQVRTFAEELYRNVPSLAELAEGGDLTPLAAAALVLLLVASTLVAVALLAPPGRLPDPRLARRFRLNRWSRCAAYGVTFAMPLLAAVPLLNLIVNAGMSVELTEGEFMRSWSPAKLLWIVGTSPHEFRGELAWSFLMGGLVAAAAVTLAAILGWYARRSSVAAATIWLTSAVCLAVPGPMIGLTLIWLFNRDDVPLVAWLYDRSILAPTLAMFVRAWPIAALICWFAQRTLSQDVLDAAAIDGAGGITSFVRISLAQRRSALLIAALSAFAIAIGDLATTILVTPPGLFIVSARVFGLLHAGVDDQLAGLCLTLCIIFLLLAMAALRLLRAPKIGLRHSGAAGL